MKQRLLWKLLLINIVPVIGVIILVVWLAIDQLAANYFTVLMEKYHVSPTDTQRMFLSAIHRYLVWATLAALALAVALSYLLTRRILRPLMQMAAVSREVARGNFSRRVDIASGDEVGQVASAFNRMTDSLEQLERLRKDLVANVAHELRTPLTNLRGYVEALSDEVVPPSRETFKMLEQEILRLVRLVEDLQQLAKADAARAYLTPREIPLHQTINLMLELYRPNFRDKMITVETQFGPETGFVIADREKLLQAVRNLTENAWKYTPQGGRVKASAERVPGGTRVMFANTGEGIAEKDLPYIFERFYRVEESRSRETGGAGIGLAIVKELIEAHGGSVGAESGDGETRVWFILPD
jgi:two-component system sensor histidine kinase BaeS